MKHTSRIAMVLVCFWITDLPAQVRDGIGAQDLPLTSTGNLRFFVDLSAFRGPEGYTRQEVALLLDASQLDLREQAGESVGKISLVAVVLDYDG